MAEPFDARRTWLSEASTHAAAPSWRTVSLVTAMRSLIQEPGPRASRMPVLQSCVAELAARGLDADALLRFGMLPELLSPLMVKVLLREAGEGDALGPDANAADGLEEWEPILGTLLPMGLDPSTLPPADLPHRVLQALTAATVWLIQAPMEALFSLRPPSPSEMAGAVKGAPPTPELFEQYRWIVDRFSTTQLSEWDVASLHQELRWAAGQGPAACRPELMSDRLVDQHELAAQIARHAVAPNPPLSLGQLRPSLAVQMQSKARDLLADGHRSAAVALFEFAAQESPTDAQAANNLGFCLLPDNPTAALTQLRRAAGLGYQPMSVNVHNQVTCLLALGQPHEALSTAEALWPAVEQSMPMGGVLWRRAESGEYQLVEVDSCHAALAALCGDAASKVGQASARDTWLRRSAG